MPEMITIAKREWDDLDEQAQKLAVDKSYLQLIICRMSKINAVSGLDNTVENMLRNIVDMIGGTNIILYYVIDQDVYYADVHGERKKLAEIADELVREVMKAHQPMEFEHEFGDTPIVPPEFSKAYTWIVPLLVGTELVGVFKLENLNITIRDLSQHLPLFFADAALVLRNEIMGHTRLRQAHDRLEQEVVARQQAEEQLRRANEALEINTERKQAEAALQRANRELRAISNCNQTLLRADDEQTLLNEICRIVCEEAGYHMAWVGYANEDDAKTVRPVAWAGNEAGYLANAQITWADTERGRGPTGTAIRSGQSAFIQDFSTDPYIALWRQDALQRGYRSNVALPLKDDGGKVFGALTIYSMEPNAFTPDEIRLLEELSGDLAFGITVLRARAERKQAEVVLQINDGRYRMAQAMGHVGNWEYDLQTTHFWGSDEARRIYGFDASQLDFSTDDVESCIPERERVHQALVDLIETGKPYDLEFEIHPRNASEPKIIASLAQLRRDEHGQPSKIVGVIQDITARKHAELKLEMANDLLRAIIEAAPTAIIGLDLEGKVKDVWNPAAERMLGWSAQEALGSYLPSVPVERDAEFKRFREWVRGGRALNGIEVSRQKRDGTPIDYSIYASPLHDSDGQITGNVAVLVDITEHKRAEDKIRNLNQELEKRVADRTAALVAANHELEAFAYSVSHDLRAPLRHIGGFLEILKQSACATMDEQSLNYMELISSSAKRMNLMIDDLLSFSRMSRSEMSKAQVDLGKLVQDVIQEYEVETASREVEWQVTPLPEVVGDRAMLRLALENLISNALKFTRGCTPAKIEIGWMTGPEAEKIVFIRDNGVGFDMQYADKLFGVFQRLHRANEFEGTGIGLANVRRIIERHGGKTWAQAQPGLGATFYFSFPATPG